MKLKADQTGNRGLPMPLWLQGALESGQAAVISAALVLVPLLAVWFSGGFSGSGVDVLARLGGQAWLIIHGVPLSLRVFLSEASSQNVGSTLSLVPLGLTLIPFFLSWRAGRRLARASYTDQLWQALLGAGGIYAAFGLATAFVCQTGDVRVNLLYATLIPLIPVGLGLAIGARLESGSWSRLIGVEAVDWISRTSQHSRWAGSYLWSVVRAGFVAILTAFALAAVLLSVDLLIHWADVVTVFEALKVDPWGAAVLTLAQMGYLPNMAVFSLAWLSGAGFSIGVGSTASALGTAMGPVPAIPVLAAIPSGNLAFGAVALVVPVLAGALAGWWFLRDGENHFDEWLSIKIKTRWLTAAASTLVLGLAIGAVAGILGLVMAWMAGGSAGLGRLTEIGPDPVQLAIYLAIEVGIGVVIGYAAGPWLERGQLRSFKETFSASHQ
ncbi:DUF6350 family protein [Pseudarthrobacter sp. J1763]|uniref:cell division protein PerM n=1 Tax=Pseudarthrobacter sp. J1763 TaxID=3420445 RepID=UPI003D2A2B50